MAAAHLAPRLSERAALAPAVWRARAPSLTLCDFAGEQTALAQAIATALRAELAGTTVRLGAHSTGTRAAPTMGESARQLELTRTVARFLAAERPVERPRSLRVLVHSPFDPGLATSTGPTLRSTAIEAGLATGAASLRLARSEAFDLGLPARLAMAGLAQFDAGDAGKWGIAVVASAERERDREVLAQLRLALSVVVASGLVLAFGGLALRNQRKRLLLSQELAVASAQSERNDRLVRADKLATMGALATGIAHEVSTPLGVIVGRAEQLLSRFNGDERSARAARAIVEQAERITSIVRGFLALARGDAPRTEHVAPKTLGEVSVDLVGHRFAKAGVRLTTALGDVLPPVACEPHLMEQVLVNLLLNACDACEPGGNVELKIVAEGQRVAFVVTDDGAGISPDDAARILDPFFTTKPAGQGSGLGLAIASELVKHHRGTLSVAARPGQHGTRACVELPTAQEPSGA
jgi:two-component system NtrC family sensor kinase